MSGFIIDENSLNNRQVKNGMFNFIKTNTITKNVQPKVLHQQRNKEAVIQLYCKARSAHPGL